MLKSEIEKKIQRKKHEATWVNLLSSRPETWDRDKSIEKKVKKKTHEAQSPTNPVLKDKIKK